MFSSSRYCAAPVPTRFSGWALTRLLLIPPGCLAGCMVYNICHREQILESMGMLKPTLIMAVPLLFYRVSRRKEREEGEDRERAGLD